MHELKNNIAVMSIKSDDKNLFRKIREIWNKIIELISINNAKDFVKNTIVDDAMNLLWQMYTEIQALLINYVR